LDLNYYLYKLTLTEKFLDPSNWNHEAERIIDLHMNFLDELGRNGILIFAGRTDYDPGHSDLFGIALIKAESLEKAKQIMSGDPAVVEGIQQSSIHPYRLALKFFEE